MFVTGHAAARFIERIDPSADYHGAVAHILRVSRRWVMVGVRDGFQLYRDPEQPMRAEYVVVDGRRVVTVLDPTVQTADRRREVVVRKRARASA